MWNFDMAITWEDRKIESNEQIFGVLIWLITRGKRYEKWEIVFVENEKKYWEETYAFIQLLLVTNWRSTAKNLQPGLVYLTNLEYFWGKGFRNNLRGQALSQSKYLPFSSSFHSHDFGSFLAFRAPSTKLGRR